MSRSEIRLEVAITKPYLLVVLMAHPLALSREPPHEYSIRIKSMHSALHTISVLQACQNNFCL